VAEFVNQYKKQLTWALYVVGAVVILLFLQSQLADKKAARIVQTLISGILVGGVYGLVALGIVVINKASGVFNFAHGWMMVVGGMIFWSFFTVSEISVPGAGLLAAATMLMVMTAVSSQRLLAPRNLMMTVGGILLLTWLMTFGGIAWRWVHALTGTLTGAILTGLVVERFTIRPLIGQPFFTAGLRVRVILAITWVVATFLASIAGVLQGGAVGLSLNINFVVLRVFPAVLLGGLESISGALIGGMIIGIVEQFGTLLNSSEQVGTNLAPYVVLMLVLVIRPDGLFGEKICWWAIPGKSRWDTLHLWLSALMARPFWRGNWAFPSGWHYRPAPC